MIADRLSVLGLAFIGLVATAAFTVMAQRRQRALGMLASLGATPARRQVRADRRRRGARRARRDHRRGAGLGLWFWYYPHLETTTAHRTDPLNLHGAAVVIGLLLAVAASVIAGRPGRGARSARSRWSPRSRAGSARRTWSEGRCAPASSSSAAGLLVLYFSGGWNGGGGDAYLVIAAMVACVIACALLAPFAVDRLAQVAGRAPLATRLALSRPRQVPVRGRARRWRRSRSRCSSPPSPSSSRASGTTTRSTTSPRTWRPTSSSCTRQETSGSQYQPGQVTPAAKLAASRQEADTLAAQLHAPAPLELDLAVSVNVTAQGQPTENQSGALVSLHGPGSAAACTWPLRPCSRRSASARAR